MMKRHFHRKDRRAAMPFTLSQIAIYPIKSLRGIPLQESIVETRGLRDDRRWMVVAATGRFLTQRALPRMALITAIVQDDGVTLSAPEMPPLHVPDDGGAERLVTIWRDTVVAHDAGESAAAWLSAYLGVPCQLVRMPDTTRRVVNQAFGGPEDVVSFADGYPFLLIGQASLDDLNARMSAPLPMRRFRPNLVVAGTEPFAEDAWKRIRIGEVAFRVVKPCARCIIPTIDPDEGDFAGKEPLRTLATFRKVGSKVHFGQNLIADGTGIVRIDDPVIILE
jgi:uncharacterized protein